MNRSIDELSCASHKVHTMGLGAEGFKRGKCKPLLEDEFRIAGEPYYVSLRQQQLAWWPKGNAIDELTNLRHIKLGHILSLDLKTSTEALDSNDNNCEKSHTKETKKQFWRPQKTTKLRSHALLIHYVRKNKGTEEWRLNSLVLEHDGLPVLNGWSSNLQAMINNFTGRPKNILFFINPYGGKGKGVQIFNKHVKPVLQLSRVKFTIVKTERRNHIEDYLREMKEQDLISFDVIVAVGGDGSIREVVNGLLQRNMTDGEAEDQLQSLKPAPVPIGVIPAGSGNAMAYTLYTSEHPQTAAIHLVLGGTRPLDVCAVIDDTTIHSFIVGQTSTGHLADTLKLSEKLRWMGPKRYNLAGTCKFISHNAYKGAVDMKLSIAEQQEMPSCCSSSSVCEGCQTGLERSCSQDTKWIRVEGSFIGISGANISNKCVISPSGIAPFSHLADGRIDLILIKEVSRFNHLRYLMTAARDSRRGFELPFVERYKVHEFVFTPSDDSHTLGNIPCLPDCGCEKGKNVWNLDGELYRKAPIRVANRSGLIRIISCL